jgi:murein DD-endopeptidase MepM/ murein hydrolase activator NlpD
MNNRSMASGAMLALGLAAATAMAAGEVEAFPQPKYATTVQSGQPAKPAAAAASSAPRPAAPAAKAWSIYVVQKGDTLTGVARRFGEPIATVADLNEIDRKLPLKPGLKIKLPPGAADSGQDPYASGPSPSALATAEPARPASPVKSKPAPVHSSQAAVEPARTPPPAPAPSPPVEAAQQVRLAAQRPIERPVEKPAEKPAVPPHAMVSAPPPADVASSAPDALTSGRGRFIWPVKGSVLLGFGPISQGQRNDGVNISGELGEDVKAAAGGTVVYAGSKVKGYGNMVLIKHPDGWDTVYAHLDKITVSNREEVKQGQVIGAVGRTGDVEQTQLHFETRFSPNALTKHSPIDPLSILPQ